jgi:hypothetical protein
LDSAAAEDQAVEQVAVQVQLLVQPAVLKAAAAEEEAHRNMQQLQLVVPVVPVVPEKFASGHCVVKVPTLPKYTEQTTKHLKRAT